MYQVILITIAIFILAVVGTTACNPPPAMLFQKGDCVVHVLDENIEGLVLGYQHRRAVIVRFSITSEPSYYYVDELKHCVSN